MRKFPEHHTLAATAALIAAAFFGAPPAAAETSNITAVETAIRISPDDSAEEVYARIKSKARRLCRTVSVRPYDRIAMERACREEFVTDVIARLGRADIAALHKANASPAAG